jgi:hypothetical protein
VDRLIGRIGLIGVRSLAPPVPDHVVLVDTLPRYLLIAVTGWLKGITLLAWFYPSAPAIFDQCPVTAVRPGGGVTGQALHGHPLQAGAAGDLEDELGGREILIISIGSDLSV